MKAWRRSGGLGATTARVCTPLAPGLSAVPPDQLDVTWTAQPAGLVHVTLQQGPGPVWSTIDEVEVDATLGATTLGVGEPGTYRVGLYLVSDGPADGPECIVFTAGVTLP